MSGSLDLEVTPFFVLIEVAGERSLNIAGARMMSFDEIAVIAIHDTHEISQIRSCFWMQRFAKGCGRCC
jgi:hypothetical protein